jgi:hypothetical protein
MGAIRCEEERKAPGPAELGEIFDELERRGSLSADSWVGLRRLALTLDGVPDGIGWLVCRPDFSDFNLDLLKGRLSRKRMEALTRGREMPTMAELRKWESLYMERAQAGDGPGLFGVMAWKVTDNRTRARVLVTLHGDQAAFERVAGLYPSLRGAKQSLAKYGELEARW